MSRRVVDAEIVIGQRTKPMTREERRALQDREYVEKLRLARRREDFQSYEDPGFIGHATEGTAAYLDEHHRFGDDLLELERERREEERRRRAEFLRARGEAANLRAQRLEEQVREAEAEKERHLARLRLKGNAKNVSGANFDLLTHEYHGEDGARAMRDEERARERAELRKRELARKGGFGYNPLTGEYAPGLQ
ncbi:hypothetical protein GMRT_12876 [Giardia muris]|uniref:Uncharacterized protein n=1 Tax=Giardia muris TaxID=5742 RepID=A0A4Z1SRK3_GIAMU|nr:hypothetical protein GMRT_12876 [Giardia muris]|eukprot:TNJ27605.1 hypothetical protein GMRT_12876 [Giardia muris]